MTARAALAAMIAVALAAPSSPFLRSPGRRRRSPTSARGSSSRTRSSFRGDAEAAFAGEAQALATRGTVSWVAGGLGTVASIALMIAAANNMSSPPPGDPNFGKTPDGPKYAMAGMVTLVIGALVALAVYPKRGEIIDLVNGWNLAHPDEPLEVMPVVVPLAQRSPASEPGFLSPSPEQGTGPGLVVPATGGPSVLGIPVGPGVYVPVTGGPPEPGTPVDRSGSCAARHGPPYSPGAPRLTRTRSAEYPGTGR